MIRREKNEKIAKNNKTTKNNSETKCFKTETNLPDFAECKK